VQKTPAFIGHFINDKGEIAPQPKHSAADLRLQEVVGSPGHLHSPMRRDQVGYQIQNPSTRQPRHLDRPDVVDIVVYCSLGGDTDRSR